MRPEPRSTRTPDSGAILLLTLVMTVVFAILVAGIATYSATALKSSRTTAGLVDTLAAAESGIQFELASVDAGTCAPSTSRGTVNGASVTTTCESAFRVADANAPFALVITDVGVSNPGTPSLDTRGSNSVPNADRRIRGPVYLGDGVTVDLVQTSAVLTDSSGTVFGGDVRYDVPGDCTGFGSLDGPTVPADWRTPQPTMRCDSRGWQAAAPVPDLSPYPVPTTAMTSTNSGGCRVFAPGIRSGGPALDLSSATFFRSGVYYFHNVTIQIDDDVAVGKRPTADYPAVYPSSCSSRPEFTSDPATGALWILSGTSRIEFENDSDAAFYPIAFADEDRSLVALHAAAHGYPASTNDPDSVRLIDRDNGAGSKFRFYGRVYAPGSWVDTGNAANDVIVEFLGGLVAARAVIQTAARVDGFSISVDVELREFFLIEARADGESDTTVRVTAENLEPGTRVQTWRVCSQTGC